MALSDEILADNPVGYWPFLTDLGDDSTGGNDATLASGGGTYEVDSIFGTVLTAGSGAGSWDLFAPTAMTAWTLEMFARANANEITLQITRGSDYGRVVQSGADSSVQIDPDGGPNLGIVGPGDTEWHHIVGTWDGTDLAFYIDGTLYDTDATTGTWNSGSITAQVILSGDGDQVSNVAIYDTALNATRIAAHYGEVPFPWEGDEVTPATVDATPATVSELVHVLSTVEVTPVSVDVTPGTVLIGIATRPRTTGSYPTPDDAPLWESSHGQAISIDKPLNGYDRATIQCPIDWAQPAHLARVEITRNDHRHFYGRRRNISDDSGAGHVDYQCFSDWHLFTQRYAGDVQRANYLDNGTFEDADGASDLSGWTAINLTAEAETDIVLSGKAAVRLTNSDNLQKAHYDSAFAKISSGLATRFYASAWCYIDGDFEPGWWTVGFRLRWDDGVNEYSQTTLIDKAHPVDKWVRHYLELPIPAPDTTGIVVAELWGVKGTMIWDHVQVVGMTADGSPTAAGSDQALVAGEFVRAAQDPALGHVDLGIGRSTPLTGINSLEMMIHHHHEQVAQKVETMSNRDEGFDFAITTAGDTQIFRTYYPRRTRAAAALTFPGNVTSYRRTVNGTEAESKVIVTGDAGDPAREEGGAWDEAALGGLGLEGVHPAPQGASVGLLEPKAKETLRQRVEPPQAVDVVLKGDAGDNYEPGDVVTFTVTRGNASFSDEYRVMNWHANCPQDEVTLSMVLWIDPEEE